MSESRPPFSEPVGNVDPGEMDEIAQRLLSERPVPSAAFRARLHACLAGAYQPWRPARLRLAVSAYLAAGLTMLLVAAIGLTGAGPLGI